jgi:histone H2A
MASEVRQTKKKRYDQFDTYIYKVLKQLHPETGINGAAMDEMDQYVKTVIEMISHAVNRLLINSGRKTVESRDVQSAVRVLLKDELAKHAVSEGTKAVTKYNSALSAKTPGRKSPGGAKSTPTSKSFMAGLQFSVPRVEKLMMKHSIAERKSATSSVYLAAVVEYLVAEILELAGNAARDSKRVRITPRHIMMAIRNDSELSNLSKDMILPGGIIPGIMPQLLPKRKGKASKGE